MQARPVDPRDHRNEDLDPVFWVVFWSADRNLSEEWELTATNVTEVLDWATANAIGRSFGVWVVVDHLDSKKTIWLAGDTEF